MAHFVKRIASQLFIALQQGNGQPSVELCQFNDGIASHNSEHFFGTFSSLSVPSDVLGPSFHFCGSPNFD